MCFKSLEHRITSYYQDKYTVYLLATIKWFKINTFIMARDRSAPKKVYLEDITSEASWGPSKSNLARGVTNPNRHGHVGDREKSRGSSGYMVSVSVRFLLVLTSQCAINF